MPPKVLISILNWNGKDMLESCLESLYETTEYKNYDVIVLDNGSEDGSVEMMKEYFPETTLLANETNKGFSRGHNQVIEYASGEEYDYFLLLNNDVEIVNSDWLYELVSVPESEDKIGIAGCKVVETNGDIHYDGRYFPFDKFLFPTLAKKYDYNRYQRTELPDEFTYVDEVLGAVFLIKRSVIEDIGGLDETYSPAYSEESDYCVRAWNEGYRVAYTDKTEVFHVRQESSNKMDGLYLEYVRQRNIFRFILTNYPITWIVAALPMMVLRSAFFVFDITSDSVSVRSDFQENPGKAIQYAVLSYMAVIAALPDIISKRQRRCNVKKLVK